MCYLAHLMKNKIDDKKHLHVFSIMFVYVLWFTYTKNIVFGNIAVLNQIEANILNIKCKINKSFKYFFCISITVF